MEQKKQGSGYKTKIIKGEEIKYVGVIRFNSITNLKFIHRLYILFGMDVLADCSLYTQSRYVNVVGSEIDIHIGTKNDLARLIMKSQELSLKDKFLSKIKHAFKKEEVKTEE